MYSIRNLFKQEPNAIREFVILLLGVSVMSGVLDVSAEVVAGVGTLVSAGLGLIYVRAMSVSKAALEKLSDEEGSI